MTRKGNASTAPVVRSSAAECLTFVVFADSELEEGAGVGNFYRVGAAG